MASVKTVAVPSVVAIRKGGLFSSANGVRDMMPNSSAGSDTYSRKKFIQARPDSGNFLDFPQAKPMKISPKYGSARLRIAIMNQGLLFRLSREQGARQMAATRVFAPIPLAPATIMVYSTCHGQDANRKIPDRTDRSPPGFFVPGRDLRYRSGVQQHRGMVALDPGGRAAAQGPAVLSLARRKFRVGVRRLCLGAEPSAGRLRRADPPLPGRRNLCERQVGRLSTAQSVVELAVVRMSAARSGKALPHVASLMADYKFRGGLFRCRRRCRTCGLLRLELGAGLGRAFL